MAYIYWDVRPEIFQIGAFAVRWYGLLFAVLFAVGYLMGRWMFRLEQKPMESLDTLLVSLVLGTIIGARLGHCFFYAPGYYLSHPLEILMVWKGGLASHGGALGVVTALYLYSRRHPDQSWLWLLDRVVVPTAFGGVLIRLGNLINSELVGTPTQLPWAFVFAKVDSVPRHPAPLYEALAYLLVFVCIFTLYRRMREATPRGLLLGIFLVSVFTFRFFMEFLKERQADYDQTLPLGVGQWLSIPFVLAGILLVWRAKTRPTPGAARPGDPSDRSKPSTPAPA